MPPWACRQQIKKGRSGGGNPPPFTALLPLRPTYQSSVCHGMATGSKCAMPPTMMIVSFVASSPPLTPRCPRPARRAWTASQYQATNYLINQQTNKQTKNNQPTNQPTSRELGNTFYVHELTILPSPLPPPSPRQAYVDSLSAPQYQALLDAGLRVDPRLGGQAKAGLDLEPSFIALSDDGLSAYVTLQVRPTAVW